MQRETEGPEEPSRHTINSMLPDYAELEQAIGLDWYALDPNLSLLLDRLPPRPRRPRVRRGARLPLRRPGGTDPRRPGRGHRQARTGPQPLRPVGLRRGRGRPPPDVAGQQGRPGPQRVRRASRPRRAAGAGRGHRLALVPGQPGRDRRLLRARHDRRGGRHRGALRPAGGARRRARPSSPRSTPRWPGRAGCS